MRILDGVNLEIRILKSIVSPMHHVFPLRPLLPFMISVYIGPVQYE